MEAKIATRREQVVNLFCGLLLHVTKTFPVGCVRAASRNRTKTTALIQCRPGLA